MTIDRLFRPILLEVPELLSELSAWNELTPFAFWTIDVLRPKLLVELGTHSGVSYAAFCQAIAHLGLTTQSYAVDTWAGDAHAGAYGEEIYRKLREHHDHRYGAFSNLLRSTFDDAAAQFGDGTVDLLHIDGFHTYDAARHDFETWLPKLSPAGVVLFHDIAGRTAEFGVWRLWDEIAKRHPSFHFIHGSGLGIAAVGAEPPEPVRWLASLADSDVSTVRNFFAQRGRLVRDLLERRRVEAELGRQLGKLAARDGEIANLRSWGERAQGVMDEQARQIVEQRLSVDSTRAMLADSRERQAQMAQEVGRLIERLGAAHRGIEDLTRQVGDLIRQNEAAEARHAAALAAIHASSSWSLARPLRVLARAGRRLLGR